MLVAKGITKVFGSNDTPSLFENINFSIGNNKKVALVGRNGCGKTTLIKILLGLEDTTSGHVEIQNEKLGYVPQVIEYPDKLVGEYLEERLDNLWEFYKVEKLAARLEFRNFDVYQSLLTLSEGQKMKVKLMEELLKEPTMLLIDEPTNHLDIEGIMWFEEYIKNLKKTVLMISHDRSFLNHTVSEIWELEKSRMLMFVGDYDNYKTEKLRLISKWDEEYILFLKKKEKLENLIDRARILARKGAKTGVGAAKKRYEREVTKVTKEKYNNKKIQDLQFDTKIHSSKLILRLTNVSKSYGDKEVFKDLDFELRGQEKVWLYGANGSGKTTLVKMIMGLEQTSKGEVKVGENLKIGYFAQNQEKLTQKITILDYYSQKTGVYFSQAYSKLNNFLFDKDAVQKHVFMLSPGERARLEFAIFAYKNYDFLILDEPDNHLDIETKEVLENSLSQYTGTLLLVSHDRYFVERVGVTKLINLEEGNVRFFESLK